MAKQAELTEEQRALAHHYVHVARDRLELAHDKGYNIDDLAGVLEKIDRELQVPGISDDAQRTAIERTRVFALSILAEENEHVFELESVDQAEIELHAIQRIKGDLPTPDQKKEVGKRNV